MAGRLQTLVQLSRGISVIVWAQIQVAGHFNIRLKQRVGAKNGRRISIQPFGKRIVFRQQFRVLVVLMFLVTVLANGRALAILSIE